MMPRKDKERRNEAAKEYYWRNREKILARQKAKYTLDQEYAEKVKKYQKIRRDAFNADDKQRQRLSNQRYISLLPEECKKERAERDAIRKRERYTNDIVYRERVLQSNREFGARYRKTTAGMEYERKKRRRQRCTPTGNLLSRLRHRLRCILKQKKVNKCNKTMFYVGCTLEELRRHIESKFEKDMSWGNMHLWHIDHIIPCASFDLTKEEEIERCFNYTNLQPLWAKDNLKKGAKTTR